MRLRAVLLEPLVNSGPTNIAEGTGSPFNELKREVKA
jgi:hypothetical protein